MKTELTSPSELVMTSKANNDEVITANDNFQAALKVVGKRHQRSNTDYQLNSLIPALDTNDAKLDVIDQETAYSSTKLEDNIFIIRDRERQRQLLEEGSTDLERLSELQKSTSLKKFTEDGVSSSSKPKVFEYNQNQADSELIVNDLSPSIYNKEDFKLEDQ